MRVEIPVDQTVVVDGYPYKAVLSIGKSEEETCEACVFNNSKYCKSFVCAKQIRLDKADVYFVVSKLNIY
jgi:hypothetical protein